MITREITPGFRQRFDALAGSTAAPVISSFSPLEGGEDDVITITGTNFTNASAVSFGGTAAKSFVVNDDTEIDATVDTGTTGVVSVTTPGGTDTKAGFTFQSFSFGNALLFDGDNDYLSIASSIINDFSLTGACLSIWVKFNSTPSFQYICGDGTSWWFSVNSLSTCRANGLSTKTLQTAIVVGQWNHFFISRQDSNDNWRIFHNGQEVTGSPEVDVEKFTIRYFATRDTTFPLDGVLDEIAYWEDVVGTEQNAIDLYNSGNGALASDVIPNPNRFYRLDESSGAVATDSGTDLVNGVLTNFADPDSNWQAH